MASAGQRRILRELKIKEISAVDFPAQVPARAVILKRATSQPEQEPMDPQEMMARIAELEKSLARANSIAGLNDAERAHLNTLSAESQDEFLQKSAAERGSVLADIEKRAKEGDAVVYKSRSGELFRAKDDKRLVEMARKADELASELEKRDEQTRELELQKRVKEEFPNLPGELVTHVAILKALNGISDEPTRDAAIAVLKAKNDEIGSAMQTSGTSASRSNDDPADDPLAKLDVMAKARAEEKKITYAKAYDEILRTEDGIALTLAARAVSSK